MCPLLFRRGFFRRRFPGIPPRYRQSNERSCRQTQRTAWEWPPTDAAASYRKNVRPEGRRLRGRRDRGYPTALGYSNVSTACPDRWSGVRRAMVAFKGGGQLKLMDAGSNTARVRWRG